MSKVWIEKLIIGCSRAGSLTNPVSIAETQAMWELALANGIYRFDTADIYAQGDSERALGSLRRRFPDARLAITTKIGYRHGALAPLVRHVKPLIRPLLKGESNGNSGILKVRSHVQRQSFSHAQLQRAQIGSMRRLGVSSLDCLLLHDPSVHALKSKELQKFISFAVQQKKCERIGISVISLAELKAAASLLMISDIQLPLSLWGEVKNTPLIAELRSKGIRIAVREVADHSSFLVTPFEKNLPALLDDEEIDGLLVGLSRRAHLEGLLSFLHDNS